MASKSNSTSVCADKRPAPTLGPFRSTRRRVAAPPPTIRDAGSDSDTDSTVIQFSPAPMPSAPPPLVRQDALSSKQIQRYQRLEQRLTTPAPRRVPPKVCRCTSHLANPCAFCVSTRSGPPLYESATSKFSDGLVLKTTIGGQESSSLTVSLDGKFDGDSSLSFFHCLMLELNDKVLAGEEGWCVVFDRDVSPRMTFLLHEVNHSQVCFKLMQTLVSFKCFRWLDGSIVYVVDVTAMSPPSPQSLFPEDPLPLSSPLICDEFFMQDSLFDQSFDICTGEHGGGLSPSDFLL